MATDCDPAQSATTFFFAPAEGAAWDLDASRFAEALTRQWPESGYTEKGTSSGQTRLSFWLRHEGWHCQGSYTTGTGVLTLEMCTPAGAVVVLPWFLGLIPAQAGVRFNSTDGVENGYADADFALPRGMDQLPILTALGDHLTQVLGRA